MGRDHPSYLGQLVGAGRSRLSLVGAMRARDVSHPTSTDLGAAEQRATALIAARLAGRSRWTPPADPPVQPSPPDRAAR